MKTFITETDFLGLKAYHAVACDYELLIVPEIGANIVEFNYKNFKLMRDTTGLTKEAFIARPHVFGVPVLFPPNRIAGGKFNYNGHEYNFPINDKVNNNHSHGFLHKRPWNIIKTECNDDSAVIELAFVCGPDTDFYTNFPHPFEFSYRITLSCDGLLCDYKIRNQGPNKMPLGLGFHTAFRVPFDCGADADEANYLITASVDKRWELDQTVMPTGKFIEPDLVTDELRSKGTLAAGQMLGAYHFSNKPFVRNGSEFNGAVLTDTKSGDSLVYEWGEKFRHSVIWNMDGKSGFICPEPQTWMINAPNIPMSEDITGFFALEPNQVWSDYTKIYVCKPHHA